MLNDGPVNKNCHKEAQKSQMCSWLDLVCLVVGLPEPRDDGEALATRDWNNFVKGVGGEGD